MIFYRLLCFLTGRKGWTNQFWGRWTSACSGYWANKWISSEGCSYGRFVSPNFKEKTNQPNLTLLYMFYHWYYLRFHSSLYHCRLFQHDGVQQESSCYFGHILGDPGADIGGKGKSKRAEKYGTKKSKERREEPLGTMSYQTSSKRSPLFWLLIGARKL